MKGWHFDPRDTDAHKRILRSNRTAQLIRAKFPAGTRVRMVRKPEFTGTVFRHIPGTNAQGGDVKVTWDHNGHTGRAYALDIERFDRKRCPTPKCTYLSDNTATEYGDCPEHGRYIFPEA